MALDQTGVAATESVISIETLTDNKDSWHQQVETAQAELKLESLRLESLLADEALSRYQLFGNGASWDELKDDILTYPQNLWDGPRDMSDAIERAEAQANIEPLSPWRTDWQYSVWRGVHQAKVFYQESLEAGADTNSDLPDAAEAILRHLEKTELAIVRSLHCKIGVFADEQAGDKSFDDDYPEILNYLGRLELLINQFKQVEDLSDTLTSYRAVVAVSDQLLAGKAKLDQLIETLPTASA